METPAAVPDSECPRCRELEACLLVLEAKLRDLEDVIRALKGGPPPKREGVPIAPPAAKAPSGKKPGGQKGHQPHNRPWLPRERVTTTVAFVPTRCDACGHALPAEARPGDPAPTIHQTYELPERLIDVTQYEGHSRTCPGCRAVTHHAIPADRRTTILGPKLSAMILHHTGVMGLSKRDVGETLETVFALPIGLGTIANLERAAAAVLEPVHRAIRAEVDRAPVKGLDETGWKQAGKKRWLWVAATAKAVFFRIHPRRNETALADLLPSKTGLAITDRWKTYDQWPLDRRQLCWAHLDRNWEALAEKIPTAKPLRDRWVAMKDALFDDWHHVKAGTMSRDQWTEKIPFHEKYFGVLLADGTTHANRTVAGFCTRLRDQLPAAFTFARTAGVEPTNNHAERVQRRAVLWRRTSFGCHSEPGCRFAERLLSVVETLRLRGQSVMASLTDLLAEARAGRPVTGLA